MSLKLMYITNRPDIARIAERSGVDWIFVDLETLGKKERQGHLDTVMSDHTVRDVLAVRGVLSTSKLIVRVNPIHEKTAGEIESVISAGADIVMLPFFMQPTEVSRFVDLVGQRARVCLLVETPAAADSLEEILEIPGIDFMHIGLNDLHLGYRRHFMFDLLADGTVERLGEIAKRAKIPFGFGGVAKIGEGSLAAEAIIAEHYRLGSQMVILSRSFYDASDARDLDEVMDYFVKEIARIRAYEQTLSSVNQSYFESNRRQVVETVRAISQRNATKHLVEKPDNDPVSSSLQSPGKSSKI